MPCPEWPPADAARERVEGLPLLLTGATFDALEAAAGRRRLSPGELVHLLIASFLGEEAGPAGGAAPAPHYARAAAERRC
jgi:hypothetical protein